MVFHQVLVESQKFTLIQGKLSSILIRVDPILKSGKLLILGNTLALILFLKDFLYFIPPHQVV